MCPLCRLARDTFFTEAHTRRYFLCERCRLIYLDPSQRPDLEAERAHYDTHENSPEDPGYRAFLNRLAEPLLPHLTPGACGLDYGAGPGPTLSVMLQEQGFDVKIYDPFFAPNETVLTGTYDFITCSETAEHFFSPADEFDRFDRMLRPGGWLGVMTQMWEADRDFAAWNYVRDPTHVCFYHLHTMRWIAQIHGWQMHVPGKHVTLFRKQPAQPSAS